MTKISIVSAFEFDNLAQNDLDSLKSTFSILNASLQDTNKEGNVFLQNLRNLNIESTSLQKGLLDISSINPNLEFVISANDQDNVLGKVNEIRNLTPEERLVEILIENVSNQSDSPFSFTPEELADIRKAEQQVEGFGMFTARLLNQVRPFYIFYLQNSREINTALALTAQRLLMAGGAAVAGISNAPITAVVLGAMALGSAYLIATGQADDVADATQQILSKIMLTEEEAQAFADRLREAAENAPEIEKGLPDEDRLKLELDISEEDQERIRQEIKDTTDAIDEERSSVDLLNGAIAMLGNGFVSGAGAQSEFAQNQRNVTESVKEGEEALQGAGAAAIEFADETQNASQTLDALGVFAADVAANINDAFSDLIFNALKGNIDSLGDLWRDTLDTMLQSFSQFISTVISNPIRIALETFLRGDVGGAGGFGQGTFGSFGNIIGSIFGPGLGESFRSLGSLFLGEFSGLTGFLGTISASLPAIGLIAGAITTAISIISGLLKKSPKLDIDIGVIKEDIGGEIEKRGATTQEFLDALDDTNGDLARQLVSFSQVQGGVGVKGKVREDVRRAILTVIGGTIEAIQAVINRLPADVADRLNEQLLSTEIDIENFRGKDKLLEFDKKGKDAADRLQEFIEGELSPAFIESIRGFFEVAFVELGALPDAAAEFIDAQFEEFSNASSAEQRAEIGNQLLEDFETVVEAFNIIEGITPDSLNAAVNEIKNLSETLGFDAVPSIDELDSKLEELISASEFDPSVIQDMLELRAAILQVQVAVLSSIQGIISSISSLNSIITAGGGDSFDLTGFINQGIDSTIGLLGQEGISIEDREELLGLGTGFLDQLIAEEQAAFQAQLEDSIKDLGEKICQQIEVQTKILQQMQKMEGHYRKKVERAGD